MRRVKCALRTWHSFGGAGAKKPPLKGEVPAKRAEGFVPPHRCRWYSFTISRVVCSSTSPEGGQGGQAHGAKAQQGQLFTLKGTI